MASHARELLKRRLKSINPSAQLLSPLNEEKSLGLVSDQTPLEDAPKLPFGLNTLPVPLNTQPLTPQEVENSISLPNSQVVTQSIAHIKAMYVPEVDLPLVKELDNLWAEVLKENERRQEPVNNMPTSGVDLAILASPEPIQTAVQTQTLQGPPPAIATGVSTGPYSVVEVKLDDLRNNKDAYVNQAQGVAVIPLRQVVPVEPKVVTQNISVAGVYTRPDAQIEASQEVASLPGSSQAQAAPANLSEFIGSGAPIRIEDLRDKKPAA